MVAPDREESTREIRRARYSWMKMWLVAIKLMISNRESLSRWPYLGVPDLISLNQGAYKHEPRLVCCPLRRLRD